MFAYRLHLRFGLPHIQPSSQDRGIFRRADPSGSNAPAYPAFPPSKWRGESDVKVSYGAATKTIAEFKLASNSRLSHVFEQVAIYEKANQCTDSIYAIFYFSQTELLKVKAMLIETKTEKFIDDSIFLIDCRNDNKKSASIA